MISVSDLKPGVELGRYRLLRELGRGAMGLVFLAEDTVLREKLCVKVLHPQLQMNAEAVERFHREIVLARRISHRSVCRLYDLHREQDVLFLTMEYVDGKSLRDALIDRSPLPLSEVFAIVRSICDALAAAHDVGVIHRDLKPRNIIVRDGGEVSLLDFGIATALDFVSSLTLPGVALGTNSYISPEVWAGRPATPRSDQYAVGVIFYNCLTNKMPFPSGGQPIPLDRIREGAAPPSKHRQGLPAAIDAIVLRALSYDPAARYADVRALSRALDDVLLIDEQTLPLASIPTVSAPIDADTHRAPCLTSGDTQPIVSQPNEGAALRPIGNDPWQVATMPSIPRTAQDKAVQDKAAQDAAQAKAAQGAAQAKAAQSKAAQDAAQAKAAQEKADTTREDEKTSPAVLMGAQSNSASWVVGGRPVDLPAIPKVIEGARSADAPVSTKPLPELAAERKRSRAPLAIGALIAAAIVATIVVTQRSNDDPADVSRDSNDDVVAARNHSADVAPVNVAPANVPPMNFAPLHAAPLDAAPLDAAPLDAAPLDAALLDVAPADSAPVHAANVNVAPPVDVSAADARARKKARDAEDRNDRMDRNDRNDRSERNAYTQGSAALAKEIGARGLRAGDVAELDRARTLASSLAKAQKWRDANKTIDEARARLLEIVIDRALVERKLRRFNDAFDRISDDELRARVDVNATRALTELSSGRFDAANRALNEGFALMEKRR